MLKKWLEEHHRIVGVFLLILAGLNGWISYAIFLEHPILASTNAVMAAVLVVGVFLAWRTG